MLSQCLILPATGERLQALKVYWFLFCLFLFSFKSNSILFWVKWRKGCAVLWLSSVPSPKVKQNPERGMFPLSEPRRGGPASWPWGLYLWVLVQDCCSQVQPAEPAPPQPMYPQPPPPSLSCYPHSPGTGGPLNTDEPWLSVASGERRNLCPSQSVNWNTNKWSSWLPKDPQLCKNGPTAKPGEVSEFMHGAF